GCFGCAHRLSQNPGISPAATVPGGFGPGCDEAVTPAIQRRRVELPGSSYQRYQLFFRRTGPGAGATRRVARAGATVQGTGGRMGAMSPSFGESTLACR